VPIGIGRDVPARHRRAVRISGIETEIAAALIEQGVNGVVTVESLDLAGASGALRMDAPSALPILQGAVDRDSISGIRLSENTLQPWAENFGSQNIGSS